MNNFNYIINFLFKDNNISVELKNLIANFQSVDNSVNKVNQTINQATTNISGNIADVNTNVGKINNTVEKTTNSITKQLNGISFAALVDNIRNVSEAFGSLSGSGVGFEQSMADLSSITGITGKDLDYLARVARETGKSSGLGAAGAADAFALLASQIQVDKIGMEGLKTLQKETITLSHAAGMSMSDAATAMAATINQFGLDASEANRVINVLAAGSKYGAAEIVDLAQSFKVSGAVAASAGLNIEQTAGAIEVLSKNNMKGAEAGTALRNILIKMQTDLNVDFSKTSLSQALDGLKPKLNDVTYLAKLFGAENLAAAQFLITNASAVDEMTQSVTNTNVAQEQAAIRTATTEEKMKRMQARIDDIKISMFDMTGGITAYISAAGDSAVMVSQMIPLFALMKSGLTSLTAASTRATAVTVAKTVIDKTAAAAAATWTVVQRGLNLVMSANPIAIVVLAITSLVSGLIIAYNHSAKFREICDKVWSSVKNLASMLIDKLIVAWNWLSTAISNVVRTIKNYLGIKDTQTKAEEKSANATKAASQSTDKAEKATVKHTNSVKSNTKALNLNLQTLGGIENKINKLKEQQNKSSKEHAIELQKEINLLEKKGKALQNDITIGATDKPALQQLTSSIKDSELKNIKTKNPKSDKNGTTIPITVELDEKTFDNVERVLLSRLKSIKKIVEITSEQISGILGNGISNMLQNLGEGISSSDWADALKGMLVSAIDMLTQFASALIAAGIAALAFKKLLVAPVAAIIAGGALLVATVAAKAALSKTASFANGGIVSGPTMALVGEYSGASNNPEVIAPLNKLRALIKTEPQLGNLKLETAIKGKDLYIALKSVEHERSRTR